jgi:hypothetical protein
MSDQVSTTYASESPEGHLLLDIDEYPGRAAVSSDEFLLDIDLDDVPDASPVESAFPTAEFSKQAQYRARAASWNNLATVNVADEVPAPTPDQLANTQEFERPGFEETQELPSETTLPDRPVITEPTHSAVGIGETQSVSQHPSMEIENLSPELIDAIARRAVEQLSEKVVQEIAWEVVPQLAELLIKRQLEEKNS